MRRHLMRGCATAAAAATLVTLGFAGTGTAAAGHPQTGGAARAHAGGSGTQLWVSRYNGTGNGSDGATSVAVSPGGTRVFVTGSSETSTPSVEHPGFYDDYATVAYDAVTGAQLWVKRYNGPGNSYDTAASLVVNPSGTRVFVTGASEASRYNTDYATISYLG
jgi:hypothetical protein